MELSLGIRWHLGLYFTWFVFQVSIAAPMAERKYIRQVDEVCTAGCLPGHHINEACCEGQITCTESDFCQVCVGETYADSGKEYHCKNCTVCQSELNEEILKPCTEESNTECGCKPNYFRRSQLCVDCSECNGASYCKDECSQMSGYTTLSTEKQYTGTSVTTQTTMRATALYIIPHCTEIILKKGTWWSYFLAVVGSPVFVLAVIKLTTRIMCWWTKKSQKLRTTYCLCCCKPKDDSSESSSSGVENTQSANIWCSCFSRPQINQDNRLNHNGGSDQCPQLDTDGNNAVSGTDGNIPLNVISPSNEQNTDEDDAIPINLDPEVQPLMEHQDTNNAASGSNVQDGATFVLPERCFSDTSLVTQEQISILSRKIGNTGILISGQLDLHKGEIENIEHNYKWDLARQNYEILHLWLSRKGVGATKNILAQALVNVGLPQEATHLWADRELNPVTPTAPQNEVVLWQRRLSNDTNFKIDTSAIAEMDWTQLSTWKTIIKDIRDNDHGSFKQLCVACGAVEIKCPEFEFLKKCQSLSNNSHLEIDKYSNTLMNPNLQTLTAIKITKDGDCLFSAASIIAFGTADRCCELRLRTVIDLCAHKDYYLHQQSLRECINAEYALTTMEDDKKLSYKAIEGIYEGCVRDTLKENLPFSLHGNSIQLYGLASVLGCKIQAVYPTNEQSPLHVLIPPRDLSIENPVKVYVMWSRHTPPGEGEPFHPNHFVPLLKK